MAPFFVLAAPPVQEGAYAWAGLGVILAGFLWAGIVASRSLDPPPGVERRKEGRATLFLAIFFVFVFVAPSFARGPGRHKEGTCVPVRAAAGDTLSGIALRAHDEPGEWLRENLQLTDPDFIQVGEVLWPPECEGARPRARQGELVAEAPRTSAPTPTPTPPQKKSDDRGGDVVVVLFLGFLLFGGLCFQ